MPNTIYARPKCIDCGTQASTRVHDSEIWTITKEGNWICNTCWMDSWDNDIEPEMNCPDSQIYCHPSGCKACLNQ